MNRAEFLAWTERQPGRWERSAGRPVAMALERAQHTRVKAAVWAARSRAIARADAPCEAFADGIAVRIDDDTDYEPDALVNCGPPVDPDAIAAPNPVVVVEVLSPSTRAIDTGERLVDYFRVPSIQHFLVVHVRRREVAHHRRTVDGIATRIANIGAIRLDPPGIEVDVAEFYEAGFR